MKRSPSVRRHRFPEARQRFDALRAASITYRVALGPRRGETAFTLQTLPPAHDDGPDEPLGAAGRFFLHAGVAAGANERGKLERLCCYITRPALSEKRLSLTARGDVRYRCKTPWRNGTTDVVLAPPDFLARLAALVPDPRANLPAPQARLRHRRRALWRLRRPSPPPRLYRGSPYRPDDPGAPRRQAPPCIIRRPHPCPAGPARPSPLRAGLIWSSSHEYHAPHRHRPLASDPRRPGGQARSRQASGHIPWTAHRFTSGSTHPGPWTCRAPGPPAPAHLFAPPRHPLPTASRHDRRALSRYTQEVRDGARASPPGGADAAGAEDGPAAAADVDEVVSSPTGAVPEPGPVRTPGPPTLRAVGAPDAGRD